MAASATDKVFDELGKMSVLELVELKKKIEDEWGITAAAPVAIAAPGGGGAGDGAAAPGPGKEGTPREEADSIKSQLEEAGATVEIK